MTATAPRAALSLRSPSRLVVLCGLLATALLIVWSARDGGYDAGTWYWGALALLALLAISAALLGPRLMLTRRSAAALLCLALYAAWSYASIAWAGSPGDALEGANRTLLYVLVFALFLILPWTPATALVSLLAFTVGVGGIAVAILARLASAADVPGLLVGGRLAAPTGYFNASAALFTMAALAAVLVASRRELRGIAGSTLRALLLALAAACAQLAVIAQSRGWLLTLPVILLLGLALTRDRVRASLYAALPAAAAVARVRVLLHVFDSLSRAGLDAAARSAGRTALELCAAVFAAALIAIAIDALLARRPLPRALRAATGPLLAAAAIGLAIAGGFAATHGHPIGFINRQVQGFSSPEHDTGGSHFATVGSGRPDFWRVALDAFASHPLGGLGQDNFADYYITRRHTAEEPKWTHSLELRLLAHTGIVGFLLFAAFLVLAAREALRAARACPPLLAALAAACLMPALDWVVHGSVDWFWEMPALSGAALAFLAVAAALARSEALGAASAHASAGGSGTSPDALGAAPAPTSTGGSGRSSRGAQLLALRVDRGVGLALACALAIAAAVVLGFPYLSVREDAAASSLGPVHAGAALADARAAARLDPLSAEPGRLGGVIALEAGLPTQAAQLFEQAIAREPGGWFAWFGEGLAQSELGNPAAARRAFARARAIDRTQPVIAQALARVDSTHPLTPSQGLSGIEIVQ
jgi:tetratricopeptide (TPR) repeat protein